MPVYRQPSQEIDELQLPTQPECWVRMKRRGTRGDVLDAEEYAFLQREAQERGAAQNGVSKSYVVAVWELITLALITDWGIEDEGGTKWPFSVESLRRLDPTDGAFLEREARNRIEGPSGPFESTSGQPSRDTTSMTPESVEPLSSITLPERLAGPHP